MGPETPKLVVEKVLRECFGFEQVGGGPQWIRKDGKTIRFAHTRRGGTGVALNNITQLAHQLRAVGLIAKPAELFAELREEARFHGGKRKTPAPAPERTMAAAPPRPPAPTPPPAPPEPSEPSEPAAQERTMVAAPQPVTEPLKGEWIYTDPSGNVRLGLCDPEDAAALASTRWSRNAAGSIQSSFMQPDGASFATTAARFVAMRVKGRDPRKRGGGYRVGALNHDPSDVRRSNLSIRGSGVPIGGNKKKPADPEPVLRRGFTGVQTAQGFGVWVSGTLVSIFPTEEGALKALKDVL